MALKAPVGIEELSLPLLDCDRPTMQTLARVFPAVSTISLQFVGDMSKDINPFFSQLSTAEIYVHRTMIQDKRPLDGFKLCSPSITTLVHRAKSLS